MSNHTSAKGNYKPRGRIWTECPICHKQFSINGAEYRHRVEKQGKKPCCSIVCGVQMRKSGGTA